MRNQLLDEGRPSSVVHLAEHLFSTPILTAASASLCSASPDPRPTRRSTLSLSAVTSTRPPVVSADVCTRRRRIFDAAYGPVDVGGEPAPDCQLGLNLGERS